MIRTTFFIFFFATAPAFADLLLLKNGEHAQGKVTEKGEDYEVETPDGACWIKKSDVRRRIKSLDELLSGADKALAKSRALYEEAKALPDLAARNPKLKEAVKALEGSRDACVEILEVMDEPRINAVFRKIIETMKLCRGEMVTEAPAVATAPPVGASEGRSVGASGPPANPPTLRPSDPQALRPSDAPTPPPAPPEDPEIAAALEKARAALAKPDPDAALAAWRSALRLGGDDLKLRADIAKAFVDAAAAKKTGAEKAVLLQRAVDLRPDDRDLRQALGTAQYQRGVEGVQGKRWNEISVAFTTCIQVNTEILERAPKEGVALLQRGQAYHYRGFAAAMKFRGRSGHMQIRTDYGKAREDYRRCIQTKGPEAEQAKKDLAEVERILGLLR